MAKKTTLLRGAAGAFLLGMGALAVMPALLPTASAQFFDDRYPFLDPRLRRPPPDQSPEGRPVDYSRAPAPKKAETPAATNVLVLGDSMADWLAYGLEDALADTPEIGVIRKHRTNSGLIRYDTRPDSQDWAQAAREIIAAEKPNFIVMMLGINDRQPIREVAPAVRAPNAPGAPNAPAAPGSSAAPNPSAVPNATVAPNAPAAATSPGAVTPPANAPKPVQQSTDPQKSTDQLSQDPADTEQPTVAVTEAQRPRVLGTHEFRTEKWEELYARKIDETIAVLKSRGVPVFWVGLPTLRGQRSTGEMGYLNDIYRARAERAGIVYVDVWDGFIDEAGRFAAQGPDFEGQIRRLRTTDGVHFTKPGARKLAHYVEREIRRLVSRVVPVALPAPEEILPQQGARPGVPVRPLVGPVVPLTATAAEPEELLGGGAARQISTGDPTASRVLVKGEPVNAAAGRADDFVWPPRAPITEATGPLPSAPPVAAVAPLPPLQQPGRPVAQAAPGGPPTRTSGPPPGAYPPGFYPPPGAYPPGSYQQGGYPPGYRPPPSNWRPPSSPPGGGLFGLFR